MNSETYKNEKSTVMTKLKNISIKQALMSLMAITMLSICILGMLNFYFNKKLSIVQAKSQSTSISIQNLSQIFTNLLAREMQLYNAPTQEILNSIQYKSNRKDYDENIQKLKPLQEFDNATQGLIDKLDMQYGKLIALDLGAIETKSYYLQVTNILHKQKDVTSQQSEKIIILANNISGKYTLADKRERRNLERIVNNVKTNSSLPDEMNKILEQTIKVLKGNSAIINTNAQNINIGLVKLTSDINVMLAMEDIDLLTSLLNNSIVQNFKSVSDSLLTIYELVASDNVMAQAIQDLMKEVDVIQKLVITDENSIFNSKKNMLIVSEQLKYGQEIFLDTISNTLKTLNAIGEISERLRDATNKEIDSILQKSKSINVITILIIFLILYISIMMFSQYIKNGIGKIGILVQQVSNFNLTTNIDAKTLPKNEIGNILKDVGNMINSLSGMISNMIANAGKLSQLSNELDKNSTTAVNEIKKQKTETEQIATATNEMAYSAADVAKCSAVMNDTIQSTSNVVTTAREKVDNSIGMINNLSDKLLKSSDIISKVDQQSQNISSVLDVITHITEQTNLLALNAAIEAARAGEHGRGFAVVADEVRELAKRSKSSADEIRSIITALQQQSTIAVKDMNDSLAVSKNCVATSNELGTILENVKIAIKSAIDNVTQIAAATKQQDASVQGTNTSVQYLSTAMDNALHNADTNYQISKQMADVSAEIQATSNRFKVINI